MLEGQSIVCFAHDFKGDPTSKTHIMRILARKNRILWVNSIGMRRPAATRSDFSRLASKLSRALSGCKEVEKNIHVLDPLVIPLPGLGVVDRVNALLLTARLRWQCRRLGFQRPVLWSFLPTVGRLLEPFDARMSIYHCVDEYAAFSGVSSASLRALERDMICRADLVLTSSEQLRDERVALNANTHFVQHGVDVSHFASASHAATRVPEDVAFLRHPVIGFFGLIADWVDLDMIREIAVMRPDWSILLIGRATTDLFPLRGLPNVHWVGPKPYASLPAYCRAIDVGIIPFRRNALTIRANPLKLREYLAAGLPVVSTPLPEVARYSSLVRMASGARDFIAAIEEALDERDDMARRRRMAAIAEEGWEARVEEMSHLIEERLERAA